MKIVALLPMKGNSERVPNKNMKNFGGAPLCFAIADTLNRCPSIELIVVNTDSEQIANSVVERYKEKVKVISRPEAIRGDFVSMNEIIECDLKAVNFDHFLQTHSTNPLIRRETFENAISDYFKCIECGFDSVFSVTKLQTRLYDLQGVPVNHDPNELRRTQDLDPLFEENSNFYIFSRNSYYAAGKKRIGLKPKLFEVNKLEAVDIDDPEDFILAESLYKQLNHKK